MNITDFEIMAPVGSYESLTATKSPVFAEKTT